MSFYSQAAVMMPATLGNLTSWIDQAIGYAEERGFDADVLVQARLAPDQFAFVRQVQSACDTAKYATVRLTGREAPAHPDTEATLAELKSRIEAVRAWLGESTEADFEGAAERRVSLPAATGLSFSGAAYLDEFAIPNFFFHITMAYAILRHNGVPLGKRAFLGRLSLSPDGNG